MSGHSGESGAAATLPAADEPQPPLETVAEVWLDKEQFRRLFMAKAPSAPDDAMEMAWLSLTDKGTPRIQSGNIYVRLANVERKRLVRAGIGVAE